MGSSFCKICNKKLKLSKHSYGVHLKKMHSLSLEDYVIRFYNNIGTIELASCGFCDNVATPKIEGLDFLQEEYSINYKKGYRCNDLQCTNAISLSILGVEYNAKTFEHIGANYKYIAKLHKISDQDAKNKKFKYSDKRKGVTSKKWYVDKYGDALGLQKYQDRCKKIAYSNTKDFFIERYGLIDGEARYLKYINSNKKDLVTYIAKHGEKIGLQKYKERCEKIAYANTKDFFIERYGLIDGEAKYKSYVNKLSKNFSSVSKESKIVGRFLNELNIKFKDEFPVWIDSLKTTYYVDYYLPDYNLCIEYNGDYVHCNPSMYDGDYYNGLKRKLARDVWKDDAIRINKIKNVLNSGVIMLWGSTAKKTDSNFLLDYINLANQNQTIITI